MASLLARQLHTVLPANEQDAVAMLRSLPAAELARVELVFGHIPFGLHELIDRPVTYVTMLRHPVYRVASHYWYVRNHSDHELHDTVVGERLSLRDYAERGGALSGAIENGQVRMFSARARASGRVDRECLEEAKAALRDHFAVVGVTERFDESVVLLQRALRLRRPVYVRQNVASRRRADIDPETRGAIAGRNTFDLELYAYARQLMDDLIRHAGPDFAADVRRLRRRNTLYAGVNVGARVSRAAYRRCRRLGARALAIGASTRPARS